MNPWTVDGGSRREARRWGRVLVLGVLGAALAAAAAETLAPEATLTVANRRIITFRATVAGMTPEKRVATAEARIEEIPIYGTDQVSELQPMRLGDDNGTGVLISSQFVFFVSEKDLEPGAPGTTLQLAKQAGDALREALLAERDQRSFRVLLRGLIRAGVATGIAAVLLWLLVRGRRLALLLSTRFSQDRKYRLWGIDFGVALRSGFRGLIFVLFWVFVLSLAEVWLTYVLSLFPLTKPWSDLLLGRVLGLLGSVGQSVLRSVPDLVTALVILLLGRGAATFVSTVVHRVETGAARIPGIYPETAAATRRLLVLLVWLITIAAAYPYLPGSQSDAFKGLSLLLGLGLSLGSTGIVAQAMSGLVVIYSRALSRGDCVRVGDVEGVVTEVNLLSTRLITIRGEEVTIPNTVVVNGAVRNFGRSLHGEGALLTARVSIGYDAPWRTVHGLLLEAATKTGGLRSAPAPYVLQRALDDFYVQYELVTSVERPVERPYVASVLHANIQDAFNAAGVQIMSPHFVLQPRSPVVAPMPAESDPEKPAASPTGR